MSSIPIYVMRGGSSRGPVTDARFLPPPGKERDRAILTMIGREAVPLTGLGGGAPTNSKFVVIEKVTETIEHVRMDYGVATVSPGTEIVDWSGTCGNMTSTVPLFALEEGIVPIESQKPIQLFNVSTSKFIAVDGMCALDHDAHAISLVTRYMDPGGSVYGRLLPTGNQVDTLVVDGKTVAYSLVDVTHPYLFLRRDDVTEPRGAIEARHVELIERIRGTVAAATGMARDASLAATESPSIPRVILLHAPERPAEVRVTAISLGQVIQSVPVTSALCIGVAACMDGTVVRAALRDHQPPAPITVRSERFSIPVSTAFDDQGSVQWASVDRTAQTLVKGSFFLA